MTSLTEVFKATWTWFWNLFPGPEPQDVETLQKSFKQHYKHFRALLTANNNALEIMAEMEQTLGGCLPFGMAFVRSRCSALGFQVYKMIQRLQDLSGGKYVGLSGAYKEISDHLEIILTSQPKIGEGPYVLDMSSIDKLSADQVGEKMANLGEIANRVGLPVPDGFVITASAAKHFFSVNQLHDEINRRLTICNFDDLEQLYTTSAAIHQLLASAKLSDELAELINQAYQQLAARLGRRPALAMRSSAIGEDGSAASFAGQYRTQLQVSEESIGDTYKEILAGKYKSQAIVYRLQRGFRHEDVTMCVGCLAMVDAVCGGVAYSRSPTDLRSSYVVISAAPGLTGQVVDGTVATDTFLVEREMPYPVISRRLRTDAGNPVLTEDQVERLVEIAVRLEVYFGVPQDIEWAIDRHAGIVVLQSRPLGNNVFSPDAEILKRDTPDGDSSGILLKGGVTASRGVGCGNTFTVHSNLDLLSFPKGSVLVVEHPLPEWTTLLPRAAAIVSETGEVAAHLATVAREFGIPALFGVKHATRVLAGVNRVTVDATAGCVYAGCRDDLLKEAGIQPNLMQESPVYRILEEVLALVTPLNLVDPTSLYFRPSACKTFHDLTRFCHEKAVSEMFSFGAKYRYEEKSARQLVGEMPYQWWVIDLDDGFSPAYDRHEKFIHIDQIVSEPMKAIWHGMTAIPWEGPPPVDIRGFGSILLQSTMNRELEPAVQSGMPNRNYFMISKNFCNLNVRLGYHFSLVETHISQLLTENYVSFSFKGGAADEDRRHLRVKLIYDVLEHFDFRVVQNQDVLTARIEKQPAHFLLSRLMILGYLLMHTRQIDMVMGDPAVAERYRRKIHDDIESILAAQRSKESL